MSALLLVIVDIGMKLIGYPFITRTVIIALREWAKTTETSADDMVVAVAAESLGVDLEKLKALIK